MDSDKVVPVMSKWKTDTDHEICWLDDGGDFPVVSTCEATCEDDDKVTEIRINNYLKQKALEFEKLQAPLYEEFYNSLRTNRQVVNKNGVINDSEIISGSISHSASLELDSLQDQLKNLAQNPLLDSTNSSSTCSERHEMWREELLQELDMRRDMLGLPTSGRIKFHEDNPLNPKRNCPTSNNKKRNYMKRLIMKFF